MFFSNYTVKQIVKVLSKSHLVQLCTYSVVLVSQAAILFRFVSFKVVLLLLFHFYIHQSSNAFTQSVDLD